MKNEMKTTVIHHSADFDGLFCREIARKFLPDAELIGWDFGDSPLPPDFPIHHQCYVMDLPLDKPFGLSGSTAILTSVHSKTIWIDHHVSSIASHPTNIPGYRIDGVAACRLAWQWFTATESAEPISSQPTKQDFIDRKVSEPIAVRLAGVYDVHDKSSPQEFEMSEIFQCGLRSQNLDGLWPLLISSEGAFPAKAVTSLLNAGTGVKYARDNEYREVITQQGFDVQFEGLTFLACNSHGLDIRSQLFEAGIKPHHQGLIGFTFNGNGWRVSLYGLDGKDDVDFSAIAKKHGGGGHRKAAGFRCKTLPFDTETGLLTPASKHPIKRVVVW